MNSIVTKHINWPLKERLAFEQAVELDDKLRSHLEQCEECTNDILYIRLGNIEGQVQRPVSQDFLNSLNKRLNEQSLPKMKSSKPKRLLFNKFVYALPIAATVMVALLLFSKNDNKSDMLSLVISKGSISINNKNCENKCTLSEGDILKTATESSVEILGQKTFKIIVEEDSKLRLSKLDLLKHQVVWQQESGFSEHAIQKDSLNYIVNTSESQVQITGTIFSIKNDEKGTRLSVKRGRVLFTDLKSGTTSVIKKGQGIFSKATLQMKTSKSKIIKKRTEIPTEVEGNLYKIEDLNGKIYIGSYRKADGFLDIVTSDMEQVRLAVKQVKRIEKYQARQR